MTSTAPPAPTPAVEGWFTTGPEPALVGSRCTTCATVVFPPVGGEATFCRNPACDGTEVEHTEIGRRGTVWSYTDAQYQPPAPYIAPAAGYTPFALAAVELSGDVAAGLVVLGQVAEGYGVADLHVGSEVELVVETLYTDESGDRTVWRWKPVVELGEEADQ